MMRIRSIKQYAFFLALLSGSLLFGVEAWFKTSSGQGNENTAEAFAVIEYSEASSSNVGRNRCGNRTVSLVPTPRLPERSDYNYV